MKQAIGKNDIVNDVIKSHPKTIGVFSRFNIDSCCGGAVSIAAAAKRDGASVDDLLLELNKAAESKN